MKSKFKFKRGEIAHLYMDGVNKLSIKIDVFSPDYPIDSDVQIINVPSKFNPKYNVLVLSCNLEMFVEEHQLSKKNKHSIQSLRDEFESSIFAHLNPEFDYDVDYDVSIRQKDINGVIVFKFTSIGSTFIKGDNKK